MLPHGKERIIVAFDINDPREALTLAKRVLPLVGLIKVGLEFNYSMKANLLMSDEKRALEDLSLYREFHNLICWKQFEDVKLDDIPKTVEAASREVSALRPKFFNVHASAGIPALMGAVKNREAARVLAVTVLTSRSSEDSELTFGSSSRAKVIQLAREAVLSGCSGIVCSPEELVLLRDKKNYPELQGLVTVVPGIRPLWYEKGDQERTDTPRQAVKAGANYLVIGRPILKPPSDVGTPEKAIELIVKEIEEAEEELSKEKK